MRLKSLKMVLIDPLMLTIRQKFHTVIGLKTDTDRSKDEIPQDKRRPGGNYLAEIEKWMDVKDVWLSLFTYF